MKRDPRPRDHPTRYFTKDEWAKLSYAEQDRIRAARTMAGGRGGYRPPAPRKDGVDPEYAARVTSAMCVYHDEQRQKE